MLPTPAAAAAIPPDEKSPLVDPLMAVGPSQAANEELQGDELQARCAVLMKSEWHTIRNMNKTDCGLGSFKHNPDMLNADAPVYTERRMRSNARMRYTPPNNTIIGALEALVLSDLRPATVFSHWRILLLVLFHLTLATILAVIYSFIDVSKDDKTDFMSGTKDFADLCVTGIVFLLGGFVTTMLNRWWSFRSQCVGGLHQACVNLNMYAAALWPSAKPEHRQARRLVSRYALASYQLLFIEGRAADYERDPVTGADGARAAVRAMEDCGTLLPEEVAVLEHLPVRSAVVVSWLAAFFERVMDKDSGLACSAFYRTSDNGRFSIIYGQLFAARNAISLCHMFMGTQLPYGYIHLILIVVHLTCLANSIFCGIHLGQMIRSTTQGHDVPEVLGPLLVIRVIRTVFVPMLLDGMILIGSVIAMPLGDDEDDFPAGGFIEAMEDECLAPGAALEQFHPASSEKIHLITEEKAPP